MNTLSAFDPAAAPDAALLALGQALRQTHYRHVTTTPASHLRVVRRLRSVAPASLVDVFGWSRAFRDGDLPAEVVALMGHAGILRADGEGWRSALRLSSLDEQLYFHSAFPTSAADAVFFGPDTYRFVRALHAELGERPVARAVDIGCGAGPAAIAIALRWPAADVLAVDINDDALRLTGLNAALAQAANVRPLHSNLLAGADGQFDLIVANPPYLLDPCERAYRHGGGELGAGLSLDIVRTSLERLAPGGRLLLYTGVAIVDGVDPFLARITPMLRAAGVRWDYQEIDPDVFSEELDETEYRRAERIAAVWLRVQRPGA
ncbi:MAG: methyltransferase [Pseudomonadota bacterium]|nr:methyltransferase [Pseudomonadota bacterium]